MDRETAEEPPAEFSTEGETPEAGRILVIMHQAHSVPGRIGHRLEERGFRLDPRRPAIGDPLPDDLSSYRGVVVFGGPQSANDTHPYIRQEIDFVGRVMKEDAPLLGICLGAQLMAAQLGARVDRHVDGLCERGYYPLRPTPLGERLLPWPSHVYHWHAEGFDLPRGAELLAEGDVFPNQAFRYGRNAYALQFHPEVTQDMMCRWTVRGAERLAHPGAQPAEAHLEGWSRYDPAVCLWLDMFLDAWVGLTHADGTG
ncbi:glutamine amidotransferase [Aquabacter sp. CN5-332]|uniref:glutamine amidotransferase n=1 Tax=Aquabacter sp. CN5-332 TaxID=3156608 RepID=UPI0032B5BF9C